MILNVPFIVTIPVAAVVVGVVAGGVVMTTVDADEVVDTGSEVVVTFVTPASVVVDTGSEVVVTFVTPASVVVATEVRACVVG